MTQSTIRERFRALAATMKMRTHYRFTTLSGAVLLLSLGAAVGVHYLVGGTPASADVTLLGASAVSAAIVLMLAPFWPTVLVAVAAVWGTVFTQSESADTTAMVAAAASVSIGVVLAPCFQIASQWQKAVVLRLGRFKRVFGPGPRVIVPLLDTVVRFVDMRIRVTDFSAEKSITKDTVPVHVDALTFWMVWDAEKAILEVEHYIDAVTLSAQTALRDAIGRNDLSTLLSERERLGSEIQSTLDAKTSPWGITILSIEFTEILVPKELEDALSKQAQAERERRSRTILSSAEVEIARKFDEAAQTYEKNPTAFQLRSMNMVYDSIRANKNIVLMPSSTLDSMNLGTALGATAFARTQGAQDAGGSQSESDQPGEAAGEQSRSTQEENRE